MTSADTSAEDPAQRSHPALSNSSCCLKPAASLFYNQQGALRAGKSLEFTAELLPW